MKLLTWLLNRKLYFHENAELISSVKTKKAAKSHQTRCAFAAFLHETTAAEKPCI